jgi:hypothetical protein
MGKWWEGFRRSENVEDVRDNSKRHTATARGTQTLKEQQEAANSTLAVEAGSRDVFSLRDREVKPK